MPSSVKQMLAEANAAVPRVAPAEARALMGRGNVLIVDVRDPSEVHASGKIKGAVNVSRGMLEFRADPDSPYHDAAFQKDKTVLVYCASGGRSALVGRQDAERFRLRHGLQSRRLQGTGRCRAGDRVGLAERRSVAARSRLVAAPAKAG